MHRDITPVEPTITAENAVVVIATELRAIRKALETVTAVDHHGRTVFEMLHEVLHDNLQTFDKIGTEHVTTSVAEHLQNIARAVDNR